jgi:hypothetical protein
MWHAIHVQLPRVMAAALAVVRLTALLLTLAPRIAETARGDEPATARSIVSQFWSVGKPLSSPLVWWRHGPVPGALRGVRLADASVA